MAEENKTEPELTEYEREEQAKADAADRRRAINELKAIDEFRDQKRAKNLGEMSDDELRRFTRQWGYDAI